MNFLAVSDLNIDFFLSLSLFPCLFTMAAAVRKLGTSCQQGTQENMNAIKIFFTFYFTVVFKSSWGASWLSGNQEGCASAGETLDLISIRDSELFSGTQVPQTAPFWVAGSRHPFTSNVLWGPLWKPERPWCVTSSFSVSKVWKQTYFLRIGLNICEVRPRILKIKITVNHLTSSQPVLISKSCHNVFQQKVFRLGTLSSCKWIVLAVRS